MLNSISIHAIKGIQNKTFNLDLYPNKPSILVAPNGFGKSSFAIAFNSFNNNRIDLHDDNVCEGHTASEASIEIVVDSSAYIINSSRNTFSHNFSSFVINSSLYAKSVGQYMGDFMGHRALLAIQDIELETKIPAKPSINYSISDNKRAFGTNSKILTNVLYLIKNTKFINSLNTINLSEFKKIRTYINPLNAIKNIINQYSGTADEILLKINDNLITNFRNIACLHTLKEIVKNFSSSNNEAILYLESIQIADFMLSGEFSSYKNWCNYDINKKYIEELIRCFDTTKSPELKIMEKGRNPKKLIITFPSAKRISNGQRDILSFISQLYRAKRELKKSNNILIIDEIFDYLDDANLIAFQYFITKFIEDYKREGKNLYCILLTHLDPCYINNFCFSQHKLQIRYLMATGTANSSCVLPLMRKRTNGNSDIDKYLFHYHNEENEVEGLNNKRWYDDLYKEVTNKYLAGLNYDCLKICLAVRIKIEEKAYNLLSGPSDKNKFIETHRTKQKLSFIAQDKEIDYPEIWSLLGIIYNDNLHWKDNKDYETPLRSKLSNIIVRNMISNIFK